MKKIIFSGLFLAVFGIGTFSCEKSEITESKGATEVVSDVTSQKSIKPLGVVHNEVMDDVYRSLMANSNEADDFIVREAKSVIKSSILERLDVSSSQYDEFITRIGFDVELSSELNFNDFINTKKDVVISELSSIDSELSGDLNQYIESDINLDAAAFMTASNDLSSKYTGTDYEEFVSAVVSVGTSSYFYWTSNITNWHKPGTPKISPAAKAAIKADISGAVVGGAWGATTGSFAGGVGAIPGALVGAGISSSFGSAAAGIWEYFGW